MAKSKGKNIIIAVVVLIAIVAAVRIFATPHDVAREKGAKLAITTIQASLGSVKDKVKLTGTVLPEEEVKVFPEADGNIVDIFVESGELVKAGQILAKIDDSELQITLKTAKAQLSQAEANAGIAFNKSRSQEIQGALEAEKLSESSVEAAKAAMKVAEANLRKSQKDRDRFLVLHKQGAISSYDYDSSVNKYEIAISEFNRSVADLNRAKADYNRTISMSDMTYEGSRPEDKKIALAVVKEAKARVEAIQKDIEDCKIKAPIAGYIVERNVRLGSRVSDHDVVYTLVKENKLELVGKAAESDIVKLKEDDEVQISSDVDSKIKAVGKVRKIEPLIDPKTRMGTVKISLPEASGIKYGMFLKGEVLLSDKKEIVVPEEAVLFRNNKNIVFKVVNNIAKEVEVKPGNRYSGMIAVLSGLKAGEVIVLDGAGFLYDGDKVNINIK